MWQIYALLAQDLIRDRQREAAALNLARSLQAGTATASGSRSGSGGALRRASAAALRHVGSVAASLSRRAADAATRLDRRVA